MKLDVLNWEGKSVSQANLPEEIFGKSLDKSLLQTVVHWQRASKRSGTHKAKTRSEVSGGGKKPFRQKGTGNARQGSIRSPLLEGGGVAHGPQPRSYGWALPKATRKKALNTALSYLFNEKKIVLIENMRAEKGKTKEVNTYFKKMGWDKALLVDETQDKNFKKACRNLKKFKFISIEGLNVYDLLKFDRLVLTSSTLKTLSKKCGES
ncbi:MAG: 50S ribosomal protein L4 [Bdellovibrionales bacterium]